MPEKTRIRLASRVVLLDEEDRLLMFGIHDPAAARGLNPIPPDFWLLPGGGLNPGETYEQAALREVREETGITEVALGPCVWTRDKPITWPDGAPMHVTERYFVGRVASGVPVCFADHEPLEASTITGYYWFTHAEILAREASETFLPPRLGQLLGDVLRLGHAAGPPEPLQLP